mmetsp:Transcript_18272/g.29017  ORF Transcript_18272/g.29017 Transcript_18272/m.29017 type:complete len:276 (-) Transcript_18272:4211-5038(-)
MCVPPANVVICVVKVACNRPVTTAPASERGRRLLQPCKGVIRHARANFGARFRVIGIEPCAARRIQHLGHDQPPVDGREGQHLPAQHLAMGVTALGHLSGLCHNQVLDPDAKAAFAVISRLIRQDHAGLNGHMADPAEALWPLMHGQIGPNPMTQAMIKILMRVPKGRAPDCLDIPARQPFGPDQPRHVDHAHQHPGKGRACLGRGCANGNRPGNIRGSVQILPATVQHDQMTVLQRAVGLFGDAVMHDGPIGAGACDGLKTDVLQRVVAAAHGL